MSHRVLLWMNVVLVFCIAVSNAAMTSFVNGVYPPLGSFAALFLFATMFFLLIAFVLIIFDIAMFFHDLTILPTLILIGGVVIAFYIAPAFSWFGDQRFFRNFARYEQVVQMIADGRIRPPQNTGMVRLPPPYQDLSCLTIIHDPNQINVQGLTVSFHVGSVGIWGHKAYIYTANGTIPEGSYIDREWPHRTQVRRGWFKVGD